MLETCSVNECDRPKRTHGMCNPHYQRFRRTGQVPIDALRAYRTSGCAVPGCDRPHHAQELCRMHRRRLQQFGDVDREKQMPAGPDHWNWAGTEVEYQAAHSRIYRQRGPASAHPCAHCGGRAENWAYDHQDPDELVSSVGKASNCRYSSDPDHYLPMCVPCHVIYDRVEADCG